MTTEFFIFGLARKLFTNSEKEVGNFFKTGTIVT